MSSFVVWYCVCFCVQLTNVWVFLFVYTWSYCMLQKRTCFSWYWYPYPIRWESGTLFPSCHNFMPADILLEPLKQHKPGISIANANVCEERVLFRRPNVGVWKLHSLNELWGRKKTQQNHGRKNTATAHQPFWLRVTWSVLRLCEKCLSILQAVNFGSSWVDLSKKDLTTMRNRLKPCSFQFAMQISIHFWSFRPFKRLCMSWSMPVRWQVLLEGCSFWIPDPSSTTGRNKFAHGGRSWMLQSYRIWAKHKVSKRCTNRKTHSLLS